MIRSLLIGLAALGLAASTFPCASVRADNWPEWRGPHNNGVCDEKHLPAKFDKSVNFAWRLPLPGPAGATPVVWDDHIYLTSPEKDTLPRVRRANLGAAAVAGAGACRATETVPDLRQHRRA